MDYKGFFLYWRQTTLIMKKAFSAFSIFILVILLSFIQFGASSCTKEVITDTVEIEVEVPVLVPVPPIDTLAVLTAKPYHMEEITILQEDEFFYYKRGESGNTATFDQEYIKFNTDKTGSYYYYGVTNTLDWDFVDGNKTRIKYTLNRPTPVNVTWENISYSGDSLSYAEYYILGEMNSMASGLRIAK